ncbi:sulfotransferase [Aphanothece hegewaldii CCALA 016]|uniref:Sulfotransferase n=1 Tax=Aphanothece hegewaldii CCALA 016 TaxID=2107694 RepID=A0A2T1M3U8_9CHRO|nr:tetratricopeptide repeat protein [Aphanothece hegewaldii]PSF39486.1 sulfotransferase [Aphanothece hegewaldii CCALA 016]
MMTDEKSKKFQEEIRHYRQQLAANPENAEIYVNIGNIYANQQDWRKAIFHYRKAIKLNPQFAGAYRNLARVLQLSGKPKHAVQKWYIAMNLEPNWFKPEELYTLGQKLQKYGKLEQACQCYRQAIQLKPDFVKVYEELTTIFIQQKNQNLVIQTYQEAIQNNFHHLAIYLKLGKAFIIQENWQQAKLTYQQAIEKHPDSVTAHVELAFSLINLQQWQDAINCYHKVIELQPQNWKAYYQIGQIWQNQEQWNEAIIAYEQSLKLNPNPAFIYFNLGFIYFNMGDYEKAIAQYRLGFQFTTYQSQISLDVLNLYNQALNKIPSQDADEYYKLARAFRSQSEFQSAINCYQQAIKIDSDFQLAYIDLQYIPFTAEQLDLMITFYQNILQYHPHLALAWGNLGDLLTQRGKLDAAIQCYQTSSYEKAIQTNLSLAALDWKQKKEIGPDFIIIGAAKCGTTSLYEYLSQHPQVILPHKKELNFFSVHYQQGIEWYLSHFPTLADNADFITGEATPAYFDYPNVPERIYNLFPHVKLIVLLRNPVERAISWHYHKVNTGYEKRSLEEVIKVEFKKLQKIKSLTNIDYQTKRSSFFIGSLYIYYIKQWLKIFPKEQLLILPSEDLYNQPQKILSQTLNFLEISNHSYSSYIIHNQGSYPPIKEELKQFLNNFFKPYQEDLENCLNLKFSW